jgi:hypothetical protein
MKAIEINGKLYGYIVDTRKIIEGVNFVTSGSENLEVGLMKHKKGKLIVPHVHLNIKREIYGTQEVIYLKEGKILVEFYDSEKNKCGQIIMEKEQLIILTGGAHGFVMIEDSEMIEVKNGPYASDLDKERF